MGVNVSWIWYHCSNLCAFFWWQTNPFLCFSCLQKLFFLKNQNISKKNLFLVNYSLETYHLMEWRQINTTLKLCTIHFQIFVIFNILCPSFMKVLHVFTLNSIEHTEWPPKKTQVQGNPPARWSDRKKLDVLHTAAFMLQ